MSRNSIPIYCYNHTTEEFFEYETLREFLEAQNEYNDNESYSTSKTRLTRTILEMEESK